MSETAETYTAIDYEAEYRRISQAYDAIRAERDALRAHLLQAVENYQNAKASRKRLVRLVGAYRERLGYAVNDSEMARRNS